MNGVHNDGKRYYDIPNCSFYVLSEDGDVYSFQKGILMKQKQCINPDGYGRVYLIDDNNKEIGPLIHTIIGAVHLPHEKKKYIIDHIDRNRRNNKLSNLRRATPSENSKNSNHQPKKSRRIKQYDMNGELINIYDNVSSASDGTKISKILIHKSLARNKNNPNFPYSSKNFRWAYCEEDKYITQEGEYFKEVIIEEFKINAPQYKLSNFGTLLDIDGYEKHVWGNDYPECKIKGKNYKIHLLVGYLFVKGKTEEKNQINHKDENKWNYRADNLDWSTQAENIKYSIYRQYKPVHQIDPETMEIVRTFPSRADAMEAMTGKREESMSHAIKKPNTKYKGFYWREAN